MVECLLLSLPRFEMYEKLLPTSPQLQKLLTLVYKDIVKFCLEAVKFYKTSLTRQYNPCLSVGYANSSTSRSLWGGIGPEFTGVESNIKCHRDELERTAVAELLVSVNEFQEGIYSRFILC